jgi:exodeoxyribonuclease VII small subunit
MPAKADTTIDPIPTDIKKLSFEDAMEELEGIVRELETGDGNLDQSIDGYARGVYLKRHCEEKLKEAEAKIEKIVIGADGGATGIEPLDDA